MSTPCHASWDANRIVAFSLFGEVYVSEDAGAAWHKIAREFGEIRTAAELIFRSRAGARRDRAG